MSLKLNPHISVDCVIFGYDNLSLKVLVIDRNKGVNNHEKSAQSSLKLPGSMVYDNEELDMAANRVLHELTGLDNIYLQQFKVFGSPERLNNKADLNWLQADTGMKINRVVTIAYYSLIKLHNTKNTDDQLIWVDVNELPTLAFDHSQIIQSGLLALRNQLHNEPIAFELLSKRFTIRQLLVLYEIILGKSLDNRNFRKSITKWKYIVPANEKETNVAHKPAQYFKFDRRIYNKIKSGFLLDN
jgi:8-oxo-dGTP diphosphatase